MAINRTVARKIGPPRIVAALVAWLTPREFRQALRLKLAAQYTSFPKYCVAAMKGIRRTTALKAVEAFDANRMIGDVAALCIAFLPAGPTALAGILALAIPVLVWRDARTHPPVASTGEAAFDGLTVGPFLLAWQLLCWWFQSPFAAPWDAFILGLPMAMATISGWHWIRRWKPASRTPAEEAYRGARRLNVLWVLAIFALTAANTQIVPVGHTGRDKWFPRPLFLLLIANRLQANRMGGGIFGFLHLSIFTDARKQQLVDRGSMLFLHRAQRWFEISLSRCFEIVAFLGIAVEIFFWPVGLWLGYVWPDEIHWSQFAADAAAFVMLLIMWGEIKKINSRVVLAIEAETKQEDDRSSSR